MGMDCQPLIDLRERVVVITGGNSGIGFGIGRGVARAGGKVAIWARREDRNRAAVEEIGRLGGDVLAFPCDITAEDEVEGAMAATLSRFGRIDALVANAGTSGRNSFADMSLEEWQRVVAVNLDGAFLCLRAGARELVRQGSGGALLGISSVSAIHGAPGQEHYAASKTAILGLMRSLAVELARHGVRANSLIPGWTVTGMTEPALDNSKFVNATTTRTPIRRWATPSDYETIGAFLCDPTITFHTGDSVVFDGGYSVF